MAYVAILVVDDTELSGGDSLYGLVCLNNVAVWRAVIACDACYRGFEKLRGMTVFESYRFVVTVAAFPWVAGYEQRFRQMDAVAILLLGVISTALSRIFFFTTYQGPPLRPSPLRCPMV